ncbi:MAG TPA: YbaK/EbsC family protein [Candidatus Saccharimonadales bacterium]|jgi:prolyl-tRNA editing enzyme YbaK/EbsC (Cys-tRNA(Pro) deacylase)|nr:YbaK/EbsC family protein [Candidatus Saccharimonadales bacterium]
MKELELNPIVQDALDINNITYKVLACDPGFADTAVFCEHYGFLPEQAANTILIASKKIEPTQYSVCVVLATTKLDVNKKVSGLMGIKRLSFADAETTEQLTLMMIGGVTAIGITDLPIYVDQAVMKQEHVIMGGGNRSSKLLINPTELLKLENVQIIEGLANFAR